ncbi:signal recognition particle subunit SRP68 [Strigomonas culicis]|nr:signal recognition particle subunit SRP68 [Strigomonas culicis]|eukprot:EPY29078.1 signal recognition particle subunit SRP68 [Strigomonas culicis]
MKVGELDDRVVYCMQRLGEDAKAYTPAALPHHAVVSEEAGEAQTTRTVLQWNGRELAVANIKVKDALREARSVPVHSVEAKVLEGSGAVTVGQMNKVLDLMDRRVNYYNDALAHARQDLRGAAEGTAQQTQLQLLVHFFLFQVAAETLSRNLFLAEVHSRRFHATEAALQSSAAAKGRKGDILPSLYASPLEVVRLYEAANESVGEMELLPGVTGRADVEAHAAVCRAGKLLYLGEAWRVLGELAKAKSCYQAALAVLQEEGPTSAAGKLLRDRNEQSLFVLTAMEQTAAAYHKQAAPPAYLVEATAEEVGVAANVMRFPPDFQAVPFKPVFVDIASTFIDYPE